MYASTNTVMVIAFVACGVIAWLFCMYTAGSIARTNGGNYSLWMAIGFLTGPVGLAFSWSYFRLTGERHRRIRYGAGKKYDMPEIIQCPNCGQSVPSAFDTCQFCHAPLHGRR